jgi:hypothetical protein
MKTEPATPTLKARRRDSGRRSRPDTRPRGMFLLQKRVNECNRDLSTVDHSDGGNITGCLGVDTLNHSA